MLEASPSHRHGEIIWGNLDAMGLLDSLGIASGSESNNSDSESAPDKSYRKSVLLVDDSADNRLILREYLKRTPYYVEEAINGAVAVAKVKLREYDFIVMDLLMPEMDGFEAMRQIRRWEDSRKGERSCIIALTAWALKEAELESFGCGADVYLTKPIRKATLIEILASSHSRFAPAQ